MRRKSRPKEPSLLFKSCAQVATVGKYIEAYFEDKIWWVGRIVEMDGDEMTLIIWDLIKPHRTLPLELSAILRVPLL